MTTIQDGNKTCTMRPYSLILLFVLFFCMESCAIPDKDFVHDDATIRAIYLCTTQKDATGKELSVSFPGVINQDTGEITFLVTKDKRRQIDLLAVKLRANIPYDAYISITKEGGVAVDRTLYGIHNITEGINLTVTAKMTGRTKDYCLTANYEK